MSTLSEATGSNSEDVGGLARMSKFKVSVLFDWRVWTIYQHAYNHGMTYSCSQCNAPVTRTKDIGYWCRNCGKVQYRRLPEGITHVLSPFLPGEFGYLCPKGHGGSDIDWSEWAEHLWCYACRRDYYSHECPKQRPQWMTDKVWADHLSELPFTPIILPGSYPWTDWWFKVQYQVAFSPALVDPKP